MSRPPAPSSDRARWVGLLWISLIAYSALYVPAYVLLRERPILPFLGSWLSWIVASLAGYAVVVGLFNLGAWFTSGRRLAEEEAQFSQFVPSHFSRRTGVAGTDFLGLAIAITNATLHITSAFWLPWSIVVAVVFAISVLLPIEKWPVTPSRVIPEPPPVPGPVPGEDAVSRSWQWPCRCRPLTGQVTVQVRTKSVADRSAANPSRSGLTSLSSWESAVTQLVNEGSTDREPAEAARQLLAFARANRFNYFEEAQNTLQLAQVIPYKHDDATKGMEYFRFAVETMFDDAGDCDCKAVFAATLFRLMGLRSVVLLSSEEGHAAVAVEGAPDFPGNKYFEWKGGKYYFCETTDGSFGFTVGEVPSGVELGRYTVRVEIEPALLGGTTP